MLSYDLPPGTWYILSPLTLMFPLIGHLSFGGVVPAGLLAVLTAGSALLLSAGAGSSLCCIVLSDSLPSTE